jgi:hypothetical protein
MFGMSRPAWLRPVLAAVAWLCLGTQLSAVTHFLIVEHVQCAEHGELIHAHEQHHEGDESAYRDAPPASQHFTPSGKADDHGHDHCLVSSERRESAVPASAPATLASTSVHAAFFPQSFAELVFVERVYAFAPKTSPPAQRSTAPSMTL